MFVFLTVLAIVLLVVIICALKGYRKKHKSSSIFATSSSNVPNYVMTTAVSKKEKELNKDTLNNPTYTVPMKNDDATLNMSSVHPQEYEVPQNYEVPYDNVQY